MWRVFRLGVLGCLVYGGIAFGDDSAPGAPETKAADRPNGDQQATAPRDPKTQEGKLLSALQEALERNAREIKGLKDQYAKEMEEQRKRAELQQKQIELLERNTRMLEDRLKQQASASSAPKDQNSEKAERLKKLSEVQQKQIDLLEQQAKLLADQLKKQGPAVDKLQTQAATLEARSKQAAQRDRELANATDALGDSLDAQRRDPPPLPAPLRNGSCPVERT